MVTRISGSQHGTEITQFGSRLYYSSARDGGYGRFDIWSSFDTGESWSEALNAGWKVNSVSREGNVIVGGSRYGGNVVNDYMIIRCDNYGDLIWSRRYNGPGDEWNDYDIAEAIIVDENDNVYVTGNSYGNSGYDCVTIKYTQNPPGRIVPVKESMPFIVDIFWRFPLHHSASSSFPLFVLM